VQVLLQTERLSLRKIVAADAENLFRLDNDPEVMRYINGGTETSREVIERELLPVFMCYDNPRPGMGIWAIERCADGAFLGWVSLRDVAASKGVAELGYRLSKVSWGQGFAQEAVCALLDMAFCDLSLKRVIGTTYETNQASRRLMERVGMRFIRTFRLTNADLEQADTHHAESAVLWDGEDVEYAIDKSDWLRLSRCQQ
jgi:RimJ/RimL family protein N-acetyltransferase